MRIGIPRHFDLRIGDVSDVDQIRDMVGETRHAC